MQRHGKPLSRMINGLKTFFVMMESFKATRLSARFGTKHRLSGDRLMMDDGGLQIVIRSSKDFVDDDRTEANFLETGERVLATAVLTGPWPSGATQRCAGAGSTQNASNSSKATKRRLRQS
jgi:hypothetical protein